MFTRDKSFSAIDGTKAELHKAATGKHPDGRPVHRLFQCVTGARRPFRVEKLAEFLTFDFSVGLIPKFCKDWRLKDANKSRRMHDDVAKLEGSVLDTVMVLSRLQYRQGRTLRRW